MSQANPSSSAPSPSPAPTPAPAPAPAPPTASVSSSAYTPHTSTQPSSSPASLSSSSSPSVGLVRSQATRMSLNVQKIFSLSSKKYRASNKATDKLRRARGELGKQLEAIHALLSQIEEHVSALAQSYNHAAEEEEKAAADMQLILARLKQVRIDAALVGARDRTLFDFVDLESVESVRSRIAAEHGKLYDIASTANGLWTRMQEEMSELTKLHEAGAEQEARAMPAVEALPQLMAEQKRSVVQVQHAIQALNELFQTAELATPDMLMHLEHLRAAHNRLLEVGKSIESTANAQIALYNSSTALFKELDQFSPQLRSMLVEVETLAFRAQDHHAVAAQLLVERRNLTAWYRQFLTAYGKLCEEVRRRHEQLSVQQTMIDRFREQMEQHIAEENRQRELFHEAHGRYLPPNLCPAIQEFAPAVHVYPEMLGTRLPQLMRSSTASPADANNSSGSFTIIPTPSPTTVAPSTVSMPVPMSAPNAAATAPTVAASGAAAGAPPTHPRAIPIPTMSPDDDEG